MLLVLASTASLLELGPIAQLLLDSAGFPAILLAGLAYQLGNAVPRPHSVARWPVLLPVGLAGAAGLVFLAPASLTWLGSIAILSWSLQAVRRRLLDGAGGDAPQTTHKRIARVAGYVLATIVPAMVWAPVIALLIVGGFLFVNPRRTSELANSWLSIKSPDMVEITMVLHQAHYFSYCYAVPALLASGRTGGVALVGLWFSCGWVTYLLAESLWRRFPPVAVFVVGHLFLSGLLVLLSKFHELPWSVLSFWVLSGLGGGTVYCLSVLHKREHHSAERLEQAEDTGHILGGRGTIKDVVLLRFDPSFLPVLGSVWAVLAAATILAYAFARRRTEHQANNNDDGAGHADH